MRRDRIAGTTMAAALIVSSGCLMGPVEEPAPQIAERTTPDRTSDVENAYRPVRGAVEGRLSGVVGPVTNIDHDANLLSAYDDGYYLSVETVVEHGDRAVMTLLSVSNGAAVFVPGLHATFALENIAEDDVQITMLGCVGQDVGVYDEYDAPADEVTVGVEAGETEDEMDVSVSARWFDRDLATGERLDTYTSAQTRFTLLR